ncbi:hypothetical protein Tco_1172497 [Tanacetum coccineum]
MIALDPVPSMPAATILIMAKTAKKENPAKTEDDENTGKKESIFWTPQMDDAYIKAMLKEQDKAEDEVWKDLIEGQLGVVAETAKESRKRMMNNKDIVEIDDDTDEFQSTVNKIGDDIQVTTTPQSDAMKEYTKAIVGSRPHVYSGGEIYSQMELMGVDQDLKASAFVFLLRSPESTKALLDCPLDMQKSILNEMMGTRN